MTEGMKRKFDAWESIREHAWREFEDKSRAEWRLSFGIWAAVLASASALIANENLLGNYLMKQWPSWVFVVALGIVLGHFAFLYWIQTRLGEVRGILEQAQAEMRTLLGARAPTLKKRSNWKQLPMYIEVFITILLIVVLYVVLKYSGG